MMDNEGKKTALKTLLSEVKGWKKDALREKAGKGEEDDSMMDDDQDDSVVIQLLGKLAKKQAKKD